jgi:hypothetical protein
MSLRIVSALAAAVAALGLASPNTAQAFDRDRPDVPAGFVGERTVRHWVYYPRYRHYYLTNGQADPFGYQYQPRGYYPYYNSGYWKTPCCVPLKRAHFVHPKYHAGWGANKKHHSHVKMHHAHSEHGLK